MRSRATVFTLKNGLLVLGLGLLGIWSWMGLASCHSDRVTVNAKDPQSPQFAYRKDELALLSLMADDIQELERKKQYATIYDDYTSQDFKNSISRRRFLIITNCVETYLGGMDSDGYDPHDLGFRRENVKGSQNGFLDVLNRKVHRIMGVIDEQMVFVPHNLNFKLNGLYWISKDKQFLQCVAESPLKDQESQPAATETNATGEPGAQTTPVTENSGTGQSTETGAPSATGTETNATGESSETKPAETQSEPASTSTSSETTTRKPAAQTAPTPAPVQEMKPAEAHKTTSIHARPAGAGAVIDQRPSAPARAKTPTEKDGAQSHPPIPANDSPSTKRIEPSHDANAGSNRPIPSSIPPLKQNTEQDAPPTPH
jgi:hypothetical protein